MKKVLFTVLATVMTATAMASVFSGCGGKADYTLKVCNWEDYIYEEEGSGCNSESKALYQDFEEYYKKKTGKTVKVEYSTFGTPEDLYNNLKINPDSYDLICPSDYMIEKMAREGMLEKVELAADGAYNTYVSPYIKNIFDGINWGESGAESLSDYAAGYMWGTLGMVYDTEKYTAEDMNSWTALWNIDGKVSIKDSVRDTYFVGLAKAYQDELNALDKAAADYNDKISEIFNRTDETTVNKVKAELTTLKDKCFSMEVDSGKNDIVLGNIDVYFAWSGDAVYAMDEADALETPVELGYTVPEEGSNVWFDGWCIPKGSANKSVAAEFIDFLSLPENAIKNMDYIGYVSCVAGEDVFNRAKENYEEEDGEAVDLSYFFRNDGDTADYTIKCASENRQFAAQYPSLDVIKRCAVMSYFDDAANNRINNMWTDIKVD